MQVVVFTIRTSVDQIRAESRWTSLISAVAQICILNSRSFRTCSGAGAAAGAAADAAAGVAAAGAILGIGALLGRPGCLLGRLEAVLGVWD